MFQDFTIASFILSNIIFLLSCLVFLFIILFPSTFSILSSIIFTSIFLLLSSVLLLTFTISLSYCYFCLFSMSSLQLLKLQLAIFYSYSEICSWFIPEIWWCSLCLYSDMTYFLLSTMNSLSENNFVFRNFTVKFQSVS